MIFAASFFVVSAYHALYLEDVTVSTLVEKIANLYSITSEHILETFMYGPGSIMILVNDEVKKYAEQLFKFLLYLYNL